MTDTGWRRFALQAQEAAGRGGPGEWVAYDQPLKNPRSAQSTATQMRKRMPDLEIKTTQGVIYARLRREDPAA